MQMAVLGDNEVRYAHYGLKGMARLCEVCAWQSHWKGTSAGAVVHTFLRRATAWAHSLAVSSDRSHGAMLNCRAGMSALSCVQRTISSCVGFCPK